MYDSRPETHEHINRVRDFINRAINNLHTRWYNHDESKLVEPELSAFDIATPKLANLEYGSDEYKKSLKDLGPALEHHYLHNDHHPQHFENGIRDMSLLSLLEMLCDWRAASERTKNDSFEESLEFNQKRFGYSDELAGILLNTARELDML